MSIGLLCGLSLQNDYDDIFIASDVVAAFNLTGAREMMDVPTVRDASGTVSTSCLRRRSCRSRRWAHLIGSPYGSSSKASMRMNCCALTRSSDPLSW